MDSFELDGITFVQDLRPGVQRGVSSKDEFILVKNRTMLEFYEELAARKPKNIVEIGMFEGGSMVYFDKLFKPDNLVGIDIKRKPIEPLEQYRIGREHIKTFYGRSQDALSTRGAVQANCKGALTSLSTMRPIFMNLPRRRSKTCFLLSSQVALMSSKIGLGLTGRRHRHLTQSGTSSLL